jgi:hypothetical protein
MHADGFVALSRQGRKVGGVPKQHWERALEIADALRSEGLTAEAELVKEAVVAAGTGTELIAAVRWHLQQSKAAAKTTNRDTRAAIDSLMADISNELRR